MSRRLRALSAVLAPFLLAACTSGAAAGSSASTSESVASATTSTPAPAATTAPPGPPATLGPGSSVPAGFVPISFTAVSATHWWLLGFAPCGTLECSSVVTTADGGASFQRVSAPPGSFAPAKSVSPALGEIRFADPEDGWIFGPGGFYATHDGGASWQPVDISGSVRDLAAGLGAVYAIIYPPAPACAQKGTCVESATPGPRLWKAAPSGNDWQVLPAAGIAGSSLSVHGTSIFVMNATFTKDGWALGTRLLHSTDGGATFVTEPQQVPGIYCDYSQVDQNVIWARCPGGHFAFTFLSTNGGASFSQVGPASGVTPTGAPLDSALSGISRKVALESEALRGFQGASMGILITIDGGNTWRRVRTPTNPDGAWTLIGFTTPMVGYAFWNPYPSQSWASYENQLWRTTDGGESWSLVSIKG